MYQAKTKQTSKKTDNIKAYTLTSSPARKVKNHGSIPCWSNKISTDNLKPLSELSFFYSMLFPGREEGESGTSRRRLRRESNLSGCAKGFCSCFNQRPLCKNLEVVTGQLGVSLAEKGEGKLVNKNSEELYLTVAYQVGNSPDSLVL